MSADSRGAVQKLRSRWRSGSWGRLRTEISQRLAAGQVFDGLDIETVGGRLDLRGFSLDRKVVADPPHVRGVSLTDVDFGYVQIKNLRLFSSRLENCRFDRADLADWRQWATDVVRCSFVEADLGEGSLGGWFEGRGNEFQGCDFSGASLAGIESNAATYIGCLFDRLERVNFWQSSIIGCRFTGLLTKVVFDGRMLGTEKPDPNPMRDVDLTDAVFEKCEFRGVSFDRVSLPKDPDLYLIEDPERLRPLLSSLDGDEGLPARIARMLLQQELRIAKGGGSVLLGVRDFDEAADLLAGLLTRFGFAPLT